MTELEDMPLLAYSHVIINSQ